MPAQRRSISDAGSTREATVLETLMAIAVLAAVVGFAVWFSFLATSSLPP